MERSTSNGQSCCLIGSWFSVQHSFKNFVAEWCSRTMHMHMLLSNEKNGASSQSPSCPCIHVHANIHFHCVDRWKMRLCLFLQQWVLAKLMTHEMYTKRMAPLLFTLAFFYCCCCCCSSASGGQPFLPCHISKLTARCTCAFHLGTALEWSIGV